MSAERYLNETDFLYNLEIGSGYIRCHGAGDLVTTPDGDIAVTKNYETYLMQRLALWLAIPKGEVPGAPDSGSSVHDFIFDRLTPRNMHSLAKHLEADLIKQFPDLGTMFVECVLLSQQEVKIIIYSFNKMIELILNKAEYTDFYDDLIDVISVGVQP